MGPLEERYPVVLSQSVIWGDMDAFGHVNNTVYFRYFEDARIAYFDRVGVPEHKVDSNVGPILAATNCNFKLPLQYPDRIHIAARSTILSAKKINMEYAVYSENYSGTAAQGEGLIIYYDYAGARSCEIPAKIIGAIEELESK